MENSARNWTLPLLSFLVLGLGISAGIYVVNRPEKIENKVAVAPQDRQAPVKSPQGPGTAILGFATQINSLTLTEEESLSVTIDTGGEKVSAVEIHLSFDPKLVKVKEITPGSFFAEPIVLDKAKIDNKLGAATFVVGSGPQTKSGKGEIVKVKVIGLKIGQGTIRLEDSTKVAAVGREYNVLKDTGEISIKVSD